MALSGHAVHGQRPAAGIRCFAHETLDINPDDVSLLTSFGADNAGELYVLSQLGGLYRIDPR